MKKTMQKLIAIFAALVVAVEVGLPTELLKNEHDDPQGESYGESTQEYNDLDGDDISQ